MNMLPLARPSTALLTRARLRLAGGGLVACLALAHAAPADAQAVAPPLGDAAPLAVLGANSIPTSGTVTCTDTGPGTSVNGEVGTTGNTITNIGCTINGSIYAPVAASVVFHFNDAYDSVETLNPVCDGVIPTTTTSLPPGVYCSVAGTTIGAGVIITLDGGPSDVWVFRVGTGGLGALTLTDAQVVMAGTAQACNVYWTTAEAATLTDSDFVGTVLSGTAVTMTNGSWFGRALATTDVTLTNAAPLVFAGCGTPPATITVNKDFSDDNPTSVQMDLTCTSGAVSATPLTASEGAPAVFEVSGAGIGATCTATETVPAGYTANQVGCQNVVIGGTCTITNTPATAAAPTTIPAGSHLTMILLGGLLALVGLIAVRRVAG